MHASRAGLGAFAVLGVTLAAGASPFGCILNSTGLLAGGSASTSSGAGGASSASSAHTSGVGSGGQGGASSASSAHTSGVGSGGQGGASGASSTAVASSSSGPPTNSPSCQALHTSDPSQKSGVYMLDPGGGVTPFNAYCEMSQSGGGWTLVLKINGTLQTFQYYAGAWEDTNAYQPSFPDFDGNEAKLPSFWTIPFTDLLVAMNDGGASDGGASDAGATTWLMLTPTSGGTSLQAVLSGESYVSTSAGRSAWEALITSPTPSLQQYCNQEGLDVTVGSNVKVRIGLVANDTNDCGSPDSFIGLGGYSEPELACGNFADGSYSPDNGPRATATFGYVLVR
jgi:Fibrinogen beta and gamma chains, C-terminal globular domain